MGRLPRVSPLLTSKHQRSQILQSMRAALRILAASKNEKSCQAINIPVCVQPLHFLLINLNGRAAWILKTETKISKTTVVPINLGR